MAKCLEDDDKRIADLSRMFFTELSTKDNAVYNHFVDMFSLLSAEKELEEDSLRRIIKFLAGFIEKVYSPPPLRSSLGIDTFTNTYIRINTLNNLPRNWQLDLPDARRRDSGMMLRMRLVYCSIRMRRLLSWLRVDLGLCRRIRERGVLCGMSYEP